MLNVVGIEIKNVLGVTEQTITPEGNIIEITGHNGAGKTSIIEAVKDAVGVSEYSSLLRNGEEKGSTVLDLGDMRITKTYKPNGETVKLEGRVAGTDSMSTIGRPASVIKSLVSPNSVDPVRLLTAKPKELLDAVLEALPMTVDAERFNEMTGGETGVDTNGHALVVIGQATKALTETRRDVNRDLKTAKTTKESLEATIPDDALMTTELQEKIEENLSKMDRVRTSSRRAGRNVRADYSEQIEDLETRIARLRDDLSQDEADLAALKRECETKSEAAISAELDKVDVYQAENTELSRQLNQSAVIDNTKKQILRWNNDIAAHQRTTDGLSEQLEALQVYKEELCENLPVEGLAITDGKLSMNGIPFGTMNTASRIDLVLELAKLSAGKLGLVVIDNSEAMDKENYRLFLEKAAKTDLTFIVARVSNEDLLVDSGQS